MSSLLIALKDPLVGVLLGLVTFAVSTAIAYLLYKKALPLSRLDYAASDAYALTSADSPFQNQLEIRFEGTVVPRVATTIIGIWNNGNQTIQGSQIVESDKLRIKLFDEGKILRARLQASTRPVLDASIQISGENEAVISFDFLDPGDGFVAYIVHSAAPRSAFLIGTVRGVKDGPRRLKKSFLYAAAPGIVGALVPMAGMIIFSAMIGKGGQFTSLGNAVTLGLAIGLTVFGVFSKQIVMWQRLKSFPKPLRADPEISIFLPHLSEP